MKVRMDEVTVLTLGALVLAGAGPNLFPIAEAGYMKLSVLGKFVLAPSVAGLAAWYLLTRARGHRRLGTLIAAGAGAGAVATVGLEAVRITSFRLGGMPGDLPRLMGVLLTDRFMMGPSTLSDVLGGAYHFWNGAAFGVVFALVLGPRTARWTTVYGLLLGIGFLASPVVTSMGVGAFGLAMPSMPITVVAAHLVYGWLYGELLQRWTRSETREVGVQKKIARRACRP